jgi:hypothetical protein
MLVGSCRMILLFHVRHLLILFPINPTSWPPSDDTHPSPAQEGRCARCEEEKERIAGRMREKCTDGQQITYPPRSHRQIQQSSIFPYGHSQSEQRMVRSFSCPSLPFFPLSPFSLVLLPLFPSLLSPRPVISR